MRRREFVASSVAAAIGPGLSAAGQASGAAGTGKVPPQLFELRRYQLKFGPMESRFAGYQKDVLVPALNRLGIKPVGAFSVSVGPDNPSVYLLLPLPGADAMATLAGRLAADPEYRRGAEAFRSLPASDPPYVRREASLLQAFDSVPSVEAPAGATAAASRVFELRTYESHNEAAGQKKIRMFEEEGEIAIFRRVGLQPVFFGRNLAGTKLPSLTYMLVFADIAAREKAWAAFREDPGWLKLRSTPGYSNAEILTGIHNLLLRPTEYSQI